MNLGQRLQRLWPHGVVLMATLLVTRDWWHAGLLGGHSSYMDLFRQVVLDDAVRHGDLWPRFAEAFYCNHGSLLFHFYAPLSYYITELFMLVGAPAAVALKLALASSVLLSGVFMALLARELFGDYAAACAGALYVLAPYHLVDVLVRHAFGEAMAFTWLPLACWGILGAVRDGSAGRMIAGALGVAFLLLTHNITAMISAPLLAFWWLYVTLKYHGGRLHGPLLGICAGAGGLLLTAFFWAPAFTETNLIWSRESLTDEYFRYWNHFVYFKQFFMQYWGFGGSGAGENDGMSFQLGLAHWALLAGSIAVFALRREWRTHLAACWAIVAGSLFMTHFASEPIWSRISTLAFVQFPWRFLVLAAFGASLAAGSVAQALRDAAGDLWGPKLALVVIALSFPIYAPYTHAKHTLYVLEKDDYSLFRPAQYLKLQHQPGYIRPDKMATIEWIRAHLVRATAREDFLPRTVLAVPEAPPERDIIARENEILAQKQFGPCHYGAEVNMIAAGPVVLQRFWYPGWEAWVDGKKQDLEAYSEYALTAVEVGAGRHLVEFRFGTTPLRRISWIVSLVMAAALLGLLVSDRIARR